MIIFFSSPRVTGLSHETMFGYRMPFNVHTCTLRCQYIYIFVTILIFFPVRSDAAVLLVGSQVTTVMRFFLRRNMSIARERAWMYTVESRGKGPEFWQPYVEEWEHPPSLHMNKSFIDKVLSTSFGRSVIKQRQFLFQPPPLPGSD